MKNNIKFLFFACALLFSAAGMAQDKGRNEDKQAWRDKVMSEKIAFITAKLSLTPAEAQVFWPVYNAVAQQKDKAFRQVGKSYKEMETVVKDGRKREITAAVNAYVKALDNSRSVESDAVSQYRTVLSEEKVALLYLAEEQFRKAQINRLHQGKCSTPQGDK